MYFVEGRRQVVVVPTRRELAEGLGENDGGLTRFPEPVDRRTHLLDLRGSQRTATDASDQSLDPIVRTRPVQRIDDVPDREILTTKERAERILGCALDHPSLQVQLQDHLSWYTFCAQTADHQQQQHAEGEEERDRADG